METSAISLAGAELRASRRHAIIYVLSASATFTLGSAVVKRSLPISRCWKSSALRLGPVWSFGNLAWTTVLRTSDVHRDFFAGVV
jgi:hypothetical protein